MKIKRYMTVAAGKGIHTCPMNKDNFGVSEITGTLILIGIGLSLFTVVSIAVLNVSSLMFTAPVPHVSFQAHLKDNTICIQHLGGVSLSRDTTFIFDIGGEQQRTTLAALDPSNTLGEGWDIGEQVLFTPQNIPGDIYRYAVRVIVIDGSTQAVVLNSLIQEGFSSIKPEVETLSVLDTHRNQTNITVRARYNFKEEQGVEFCSKTLIILYKSSDEQSWTEKVVENWDGEGSDPFGSTGLKSIKIDGLTVNVCYIYEAKLIYQFKIYDAEGTSCGQQDFSSLGGQKTVVTRSYVALHLRFDEANGFTAYDSSGNNNNFNLYPNNQTSEYYETTKPIWSISDKISGVSSLKCDGMNDYVYNSSNMLANNPLRITDAITVEAWIKPLQDCSGSVVEISHENNRTFGNNDLGLLEVEMMQINSGVFVFVGYSMIGSTNSRGVIGTIHINPKTGSITEHSFFSYYNDSYTFEQNACFSPQIVEVKRTGDIVSCAIFYQGTNRYGVIKIIDVDCVLGTIEKTVQAEYIFHYGNCFDPDVLPVFGTTDKYVVVFSTGTTNNAFGSLQVLQINKNTESWVFTNISYVDFKAMYNGLTAGLMRQPDIVHVNGNPANVYVIVYLGADDDGWLRRVYIDTTGTSSAPQNEYGLFDDYDGVTPQIAYVSDNIYSLVYGGGLVDGQIIGTMKTYEFFPNAQFSTYTEMKASFVVEAQTSFFTPRIIRLSDGFVAVVYRGPLNFGYVKTYHIGPTGTITVKDSKTFESNVISWPNIIHVASDFFGIVYAIGVDGTDTNNGKLCIYQITSATIGDLKDSCWLGAINCYSPTFVHVSDTIYALFFIEHTLGYINTISISDQGVIGENFIARYPFSHSLSSSNRLDVKKIGSDESFAYFVLSFTNGSNPMIRTLKIQRNGGSIDLIDSWTDPGKFGSETKIFHIQNSVYALVCFNGATSEIDVRTYRISNTGDIENDTPVSTMSFAANPQLSGFYYYTISTIQSVQDKVMFVYLDETHKKVLCILPIHFTTGVISQAKSRIPLSSYGCYSPELFHVRDTHYALVSTDVSLGNYNGSLLIFSLDPTTFQCTVIDYQKSFLWSKNTDSSTVRFDTTHFLCIFGSSTTGYMSSFTISHEMQIRNQFDSRSPLLGFPKKPTLLQLGSSSKYAAFYQGKNQDGYLEIFSTEVKPSLRRILAKGVFTEFRLLANNTALNYTILLKNSQQNNYKVSDECSLQYTSHPNSWKYIAITFDSQTSMITLYNFYDYDASTENISYEKKIKTLPEYSGPYKLVNSAQPYYFGFYNALYDEIMIHRIAQDENYFKQRFTKLFPGG